jgi:hypothetical protein
MAIIKHQMAGGFCLSQRWQSYTIVELTQGMEEYTRQYPPMGYSTRFTEPYFDEEERKWNTIMNRDSSCD